MMRYAAVLGAGADVLRSKHLPQLLHDMICESWKEDSEDPTAEGLRSALDWLNCLATQVRELDIGGVWNVPGCVGDLHLEAPRFQNRIAHYAGRRAFSKLFQASPVRDRARLRALGGLGASAWLATIPIVRELELTSDVVEKAVRFFLGQQVMENALGPCVCGFLRSGDDHLLLCNSRGALTRRHNTLRDLLYNMLVGTGLQVIKEPQGLHPLFLPNEGGDLLVWRGGKYLLVDVTVVHPRTRRDADVTGAAAATITLTKNRKYRDRAAAAGWDFEVAPFETYGAIPESVFGLVDLASARMGTWERVVDASWATRSAKEYWAQVVSCALVRENVRVMNDNRTAGLAGAARSMGYDPTLGDVLMRVGGGLGLAGGLDEAAPDGSDGMGEEGDEGVT